MNILSIIIIAIFILIILSVIGIKLYKTIKLNGLKQTAIDLICRAEKEYEKGKNSEKFQSVCNTIVALLPAPARIFINQSTIEYFVQKVFDSIKVALDTETK